MQRKLPMNPFHLATGVLLATLLAGGAAAQFNTEALKKMQKEGHKIVEEQQAAEAAKPATGTQAAGAPLARHAYRFGADLCLDARGVLSVETCDGRIASQQWALDAGARLVATMGAVWMGAAWSSARGPRRRSGSTTSAVACATGRCSVCRFVAERPVRE
jgi:hypothetical protein